MVLDSADGTVGDHGVAEGRQPEYESRDGDVTPEVDHKRVQLLSKVLYTR
ncbi:MAG TPA: hypothetical protein VNS60_12660 [Solirubrobacterales bacterium]|nr:hypothetical protein [Solirubrobacterales bacterium]